MRVRVWVRVRVRVRVRAHRTPTRLVADTSRARAGLSRVLLALSPRGPWRAQMPGGGYVAFDVPPELPASRRVAIRRRE